MTENRDGKAAPVGSAVVHRVVLRNYRSIAACDVTLGPMTYLVGPNGSGKSNFLDALRLVTDALRTSLDHALRERGGINEVRRRSSGHPMDFGIRVEFQIGSETGHLAFDVGARAGGDFVVKREECMLGNARYIVLEGQAVATVGVAPPAADDRLYLVNAAGLPEFRPVFDLLSSLGFYNISPAAIRELQPPDKGDLLARDGRNLASVLERLAKSAPNARKRIEEYLGRIVPGIEGVDRKDVGHMETLEFRQRVQGAAHPWRFPAINMSDGTLRALAILVAVFQSRGERRVRLIGIEEPEIALHPAAEAYLRDALRDGARQMQVILTSHSPELLDDPRINEAEILSVTARDGTTAIAPLDEPTRSILRDQLYTPGELLRTDQLGADLGSIPDAAQLRLFDVVP